MCPLLFLANLNEMLECVRSNFKLFADDRLLYRRIQNNADCRRLQEDVDKFQELGQKWQMAFNQKLTLRTEAKYLEVTIRSDLSWNRHANNVTKKANFTMGFLKRNIRYAPQAAKETVHKTFVRPIAEYAATIWASFTVRLRRSSEGSTICVK